MVGWFCYRLPLPLPWYRSRSHRRDNPRACGRRLPGAGVSRFSTGIIDTTATRRPASRRRTRSVVPAPNSVWNAPVRWTTRARASVRRRDRPARSTPPSSRPSRTAPSSTVPWPRRPGSPAASGFWWAAHLFGEAVEIRIAWHTGDCAPPAHGSAPTSTSTAGRLTSHVRRYFLRGTLAATEWPSPPLTFCHSPGCPAAVAHNAAMAVLFQEVLLLIVMARYVSSDGCTSRSNTPATG